MWYLLAALVLLCALCSIADGTDYSMPFRPDGEPMRVRVDAGHVRATGAAHAVRPRSDDDRCHVDRYRIGAEICTVVTCSDDVFWEYHPTCRPRLSTDREERCEHLGPGLVWTNGCYDPIANLIWMPNARGANRDDILIHELCHWDETLHGWEVARLRWLYLYYKRPCYVEGDAFARLGRERACALTWGWWIPAEVAAAVQMPVLITDDTTTASRSQP